MKTIWKYTLSISGKSSLNLPLGYKILSFGNQDEKPVIWVLHESGNATTEVEFRLFGTGEEIQLAFNTKGYIGTALFRNGKVVFHLFQVIDYDYEEEQNV